MYSTGRKRRLQQLFGWVVDRLSEEGHTFIANTPETAKKGISRVLAKIGVGVEKLVDLDYIDDLVASLNVDVKVWLEKLQSIAKGNTFEKALSAIAADAVVDAIIDSVENIADTFLNVAGRLVRLLKQIANAEIKVPLLYGSVEFRL
ncbi:hypothetical protein F5X97DRAFT_345937 [Nemania serpens]|nr:hypothetical protein F5X97DRAFT_345937 [Nemania serpens]